MCIDDQMLSAYLDGELSEPFCSQVEEHVGYCQACKERLGQLKALSLRIKDAAVPAEQLLGNKDKVFGLLEQKCFSSKRRNFFRRKIEMGLPSMITAAAAAGEVPTAVRIGKSATKSSIARPAADGMTVTRIWPTM